MTVFVHDITPFGYAICKKKFDIWQYFFEPFYKLRVQVLLLYLDP